MYVGGLTCFLSQYEDNRTRHIAEGFSYECAIIVVYNRLIKFLSVFLKIDKEKLKIWVPYKEIEGYDDCLKTFLS